MGENIKSISGKLKPAIFYIVLFLFILAFSTTANSYDFDLWARLIVGKSVIQTGQVLKHDFLSYTPTHLWYDHEWGSSVVFYITQHFFHSTGILILQSILIFLIFFFITKIIKLRGLKTTSAYNFLFYYFAYSAMSEILNIPIRCQLFSFLFFTIYLYILELARKDRNKPLILIPLIMLFWNNMHGGCLAGIGLIVIYILGEFLNKKPIKKYIWTFLAAILVLPINPWGIDYLKFLFSAGTMERKYVMEWWGAFSKLNLGSYLKPKFWGFAILLSEIILVIKKAKKKELTIDKTALLTVLTTLILAIQHTKLIPFFIISASSFLYDDFYTVFNSLTKNIFQKIERLKEPIIYGLILAFALINIKQNINKVSLNPLQYPIFAVEFIKENNIRGNIFTNFGLGSFVAYKLYPQNKIYIDGRYEEVYPDYLMELLSNFYFVRNDWGLVLRKFPPDILLVEKYYKAYHILKSDKKWKLVYDKDKNFGVFVRADKVKNKYIEPTTDINYYKDTLFDTDVDFKRK